MTKELEQENIVRALKGEKVLRACVNCVHYQKAGFAEVNHRCIRDYHLGFHPVSGKKAWIGETYTCEAERKMPDTFSSQRSNDPCGQEGKHFEAKSSTGPFWKKWFKKDA